MRNIDELTVVGANNAISNLTNVRRIVENIIKEKKYKSSLSKKLLEDIALSFTPRALNR